MSSSRSKCSELGEVKSDVGGGPRLLTRNGVAAVAVAGSPPPSNTGGETESKCVSESKTPIGVLGACSGEIPGFGTFQSSRMLLDWWQASISVLCGESIVRQCGEGIETSKRQMNFRQAHEHPIMGGTLLRAWDAVNAHGVFGSDYQHVVIRGDGLPQCNGDLIESLEDAIPCRIDVAHDFRFTSWTTRSLYAAFRDSVLVQDHRFIDNVTARRPGGDSWIIGGDQSDVRLTIYDKGMQQSERGQAAFTSFGADQCPAHQWQRMELRLRDDAAQDFWRAWKRDRATAAAMCRGRISSMVDGLVWDTVSPWETSPDVVPESAQALFHFVKQNAVMIAAARDAGVDLAALADQRLSTADRWARLKHRRRVDGLLAVENLQALIAAALKSGRLTSPAVVTVRP